MTTFPRNAQGPEEGVHSVPSGPLYKLSKSEYEEYREARLHILSFAFYQARVIKCARDNGVKAAVRASGLGKSTIYRWLNGKKPGI